MKKVAYDDYYKKKDYFGNPYPGLIEFFQDYHQKGVVLDLGSGQGRDALTLGELGYKVIGVDHSSVGINQLNQEAKKRGLNVQGIVGDVHDYQITEDIDIVLLDSMLHFYKNDLKKETEFVTKILNQLKENGIFVNCILKGDKRESILKQIIDQSPYEWTVLSECYTEYIEFNATYHLLVVKKGKRIK